MKFGVLHVSGIVFGIVISSLSFLFLRNFFSFSLVVSAIVVLLPFLFTILREQKDQREKEERFLQFSRDLVENVKSGTPISKSIINLKKRDYGALSSHVVKLASQLALGITLTEAFQNFAKDTKSKVISRAVGLISEAERAGGRIETVLEAVTISINQIEILRKERKAAVSNLVTQGYIIFMVFIIIMLILEFRILPLVSEISAPSGLSVQVSNAQSLNNFSMPLFVMLLVQSFFAGLVIGKISEGTLKSGVKHSFILIALTLLITTGARAIFG